MFFSKENSSSLGCYPRRNSCPNKKEGVYALLQNLVGSSLTGRKPKRLTLACNVARTGKGEVIGKVMQSLVS